jgi:hypothetical protein
VHIRKLDPPLLPMLFGENCDIGEEKNGEMLMKREEKGKGLRKNGKVKGTVTSTQKREKLDKTVRWKEYMLRFQGSVKI